MNPIVRCFLRAKHWQIFLCYFTLFVVATLVSARSELNSPTSLVTVRGRLVFLGFWVLCMGFFALWLWSMGLFLNSIVDPKLRRGTRLFGVSLAYTLIYVFVFAPVFSSSDPLIVLLMLPLHLFTIFAMFYSIYFVARSLVQVERGGPAPFYGYASPFFLLLFFPVGVWFTQPRINRLYQQRATATLIS